jgi:rod shape-determining protein MreC
MKRISNLVSGYVRSANLAAIVLLSLVLMLGGLRVTGAVGGVTVAIFYYPFSQVKTTILELVRVRQENERLGLALRETTLRLTRLREVDRENERLRALLDFEPPPDYRLIQARVISVAGETGPVSAVINRGWRDSVTAGMPVINQQGLIGRVVSVFEGVATVQLLTDPTHRVAARVAETREMGIVKYRNKEGMLLDNLPIQGKVEVGHQVFSSGLGGIYPAGLVIGTVLSVERPEEAPFCGVRIEPAVNYNSLEEMFVLKAVTP